MRTRLLDAALVCVARVGVTKTTLDDVAREAGCARATVYRHFPAKPALLAGAIQRETERLGAEIRAEVADAGTLLDAAVAGITRAAELVAGHEALRTVLEVEPEVLLPHISFEHGARLTGAAVEQLAPAFARFEPAIGAERAVEWLARLALSFLCSPDAAQLLDAARVRELIEDFVMPGLTRPVPSAQGVLS
jgi:AcrR family transcriptional regulator